MVIRRKSRNMSLKTPLGICLLAGASSIALAAVVVVLSTQPVHADARLPQPASTPSPASPVLSATPVIHPSDENPSLGTPAMQTAKKAPETERADKLHGIASWYGAVLDGHRTASGERFDMYAMTACHPTLPFGTLVRVVDKKTKRSVVVRINDRGILSEGRIIDLSYAAAQELKIVKSGLASVDVQVISLGRPSRHTQ
jgi:rare lipoprotein A